MTCLWTDSLSIEKICLIYSFILLYKHMFLCSPKQTIDGIDSRGVIFLCKGKCSKQIIQIKLLCSMLKNMLLVLQIQTVRWWRLRQRHRQRQLWKKLKNKLSFMFAKKFKSLKFKPKICLLIQRKRNVFQALLKKQQTNQKLFTTIKTPSLQPLPNNSKASTPKPQST